MKRRLNLHEQRLVSSAAFLGGILHLAAIGWLSGILDVAVAVITRKRPDNLGVTALTFAVNIATLIVLLDIVADGANLSGILFAPVIGFANVWFGVALGVGLTTGSPDYALATLIPWAAGLAVWFAPQVIDQVRDFRRALNAPPAPPLTPVQVSVRAGQIAAAERSLAKREAMRTAQWKTLRPVK